MVLPCLSLQIRFLMLLSLWLRLGLGFGLALSISTSTSDLSSYISLSSITHTGGIKMPGLSLWLVPPEASDLYETVYSLIVEEVPAIYPNATPPHFTPHVTLTADTVSDQDHPQFWLDSITLPESVQGLNVSIEQLDAGKIFFQSLIMKCEKSAGLCELALHCRVAGAEDTNARAAEMWVQEGFVPHCSLM